MTDSSFFILQKTEFTTLLDEKLESYHQKLTNTFQLKDEILNLKSKLKLTHLTDLDLVIKLNQLLRSNLNLLEIIQTSLKEFLNEFQHVHVETLPTNDTTSSTETTQMVIDENKEEEIHNGDYYCKKGDAYYAQNKIDEAWAYFEKALEIEPNNPNAINGKGLILNDRQDYTDAIQLYDKAISIDNDNPDYFYNRGCSYVNLEEYEDAISSFKQAIELNSNVEEFHFDLGRALYKLAQNHNKEKSIILSAIESFENSIRLNSNVADYYFAKSEAQYEIDENEEALEQVNKAIQLEPLKGEYFFKKGQILNEMADFYKSDEFRYKAIDCYKKAIELGTNNEDYDLATFYSDLGYVYFHMKKFLKALNCFDESLKLDPKNWIAYRGKGVVYNDKGRGDKKDYVNAIACYDEAIKLAPTDDELYYFKGVSYHKLGTYDDKRCKYLKNDLKEAIICYEKAIELNPNNSEYHYNKGYSLFCVKDFNSALIAFEKAIKLDKTKSNYFRSKGDTLLELKRYEDAKASYKKVLNLDPDDSDIKKKLAIIKQKISCLTSEKNRLTEESSIVSVSVTNLHSDISKENEINESCNNQTDHLKRKNSSTSDLILKRSK